MRTVAENLEILYNSVQNIKQAITEKDGDASGDITTWGNVISGISGGGGNSEEEITFTGSVLYNTSNFRRRNPRNLLDASTVWKNFSNKIHSTKLGRRSHKW